MIKVDASFIAAMLQNKTPDGDPAPAFVSTFVGGIPHAEPWTAGKVRTFLNRLMEKQKVT